MNAGKTERKNTKSLKEGDEIKVFFPSMESDISVRAKQKNITAVCYSLGYIILEETAWFMQTLRSSVTEGRTDRASSTIPAAIMALR